MVVAVGSHGSVTLLSNFLQLPVVHSHKLLVEGEQLLIGNYPIVCQNKKKISSVLLKTAEISAPNQIQS